MGRFTSPNTVLLWEIKSKTIRKHTQWEFTKSCLNGSLLASTDTATEITRGTSAGLGKAVLKQSCASHAAFRLQASVLKSTKNFLFLWFSVYYTALLLYFIIPCEFAYEAKIIYLWTGMLILAWSPLTGWLLFCWYFVKYLTYAIPVYSTLILWGRYFHFDEDIKIQKG